MPGALITTHVLDLVRGQPAAGIRVLLYFNEECLAEGLTNKDGRVAAWDREFILNVGPYRLIFDVEPWFAGWDQQTFYEDVQISFRINEVSQHYHVPLLLSPFGYSTYRGS